MNAGTSAVIHDVAFDDAPAGGTIDVRMNGAVVGSLRKHAGGHPFVFFDARGDDRHPLIEESNLGALKVYVAARLTDRSPSPTA